MPLEREHSLADVLCRHLFFLLLSPVGRPEVGLHALKLARMSTANGPFAVMADRIARLHVVFSSSHFSLFAAPLNQFAKPSDRFLNGFAISDLHVNHRPPLVRHDFSNPRTETQNATRHILKWRNSRDF